MLAYIFDQIENIFPFTSFYFQHYLGLDAFLLGFVKKLKPQTLNCGRGIRLQTSITNAPVISVVILFLRLFVFWFGLFGVICPTGEVFIYTSPF